MNLIDGSISVLNDAQFYLQKIDVTNYNQSISLMSDSTIGQHTRHFIEFYQCLLQQASQKVINYCERNRNHDIETNPLVALSAVDEILSQLESLDLAVPVILKTSKSGEESINSNLGRELFYNMEHCIHHLALIKIGLKIVLPTLHLPAHFGIAPSTIQHRKTALQQS